MGGISELLAGERIADLVLAVLLIEAVALTAYHRRTRRGLAPAAVVLNLAAGAALLLALRGALVGAGWGWIALALAGALAAHLADLRHRWAAADPRPRRDVGRRCARPSQSESIRP